jgi:hypothetical protein
VIEAQQPVLLVDDDAQRVEADHFRGGPSRAGPGSVRAKPRERETT